MSSSLLMPGDQFLNGWHKFHRHLDEGLPGVGERRFILSDGFVFGLVLIVVNQCLYAGLVPAGRIMVRVLFHDPPRRLRRRYASSGLPLKSYAVTTKTESCS